MKIRRQPGRRGNAERGTLIHGKPVQLADFDIRAANGEKPRRSRRGGRHHRRQAGLPVATKALPVSEMSASTAMARYRRLDAGLRRTRQTYPHDQATGYSQARFAALTVKRPL